MKNETLKELRELEEDILIEIDNLYDEMNGTLNQQRQCRISNKIYKLDDEIDEIRKKIYNLINK